MTWVLILGGSLWTIGTLFLFAALAFGSEDRAQRIEARQQTRRIPPTTAQRQMP